MAFGKTKNESTNYDKFMSLKTAQYDALICKAETLHRDNGDKPTKEEARCYNEASKICDEIANMNLSQRAVYTKWKNRSDSCLESVAIIVKAIDPTFGQKPSDEPENSALSGSQPPKAKAKVKPVQANTNSARSASEVKKDEGDTRVPVYTESGFMTLNSSNDVPAATIEQWYKSAPDHDFSTVSGMEKEKALLGKIIQDNKWKQLNQLLKYKTQKAILFYGLPGSGKTFVIESFVAELMKQGYKYMKLKGGDIHASLVGVAEKTIEVAFREAVDNQPCVIFIDEFEAVCVDKNVPNIASHEKNLTTAFLQAYNLLTANDMDVVFLAATNHPGSVDTAMMDRIYTVYVPLPEAKARAEYIKKQFENITIADDLTYEYMGEATDNCSYRDLIKITNFVAEKFRNYVIDNCKVIGSDGDMDITKTQEKANDAIESGKFKLMREMFDEVIHGFKPSDKLKNLKELQEFEENFSKINEE